MNANTAERHDTDIWQPDYWTVSKWFSLLIAILVAWVGSYLFAHSSNGVQGYEYAHFTNTQVRQINRILTTEGLYIGPSSQAANGTLIDSASTISTANTVNELTPLSNVAGCDMACRVDKALIYINSEFDNTLMPAQLQGIRQYISTFGPQEIGVFLADYKLKIKSYFWLSGPMLYAEVVFWVIAGVLCSLVFSVGLSFRNTNRRSFNSKDVLYQVAKLFYAPFITLIIILAYNYFKENTTLSANLGQGLLVFGFIAGFYSGRFMNFFNNLKHLLLPGNETHYQMVPAMQPAMMPVQTQAYVAPEVVETETVEREKPKETLAVDENGSLNTAIRPKPVADESQIEVQIEVKLDGSTLFDDEKEDLMRKGFARTIVTLHNVNGKDIIPAKKTMDKDGAIFVASGVKPGIYIARATLSQRLKDDQLVNLFGERTSYITVDKPGLELYMRKYELVD